VLDLKALKQQLIELHTYLGEGWAVSTRWDGKRMTLVARRTDVPLPMRSSWVLPIIDDTDFELGEHRLVAEFADGARRWFAPPKQDVFVK
jgi:hypothetical protein